MTDDQNKAGRSARVELTRYYIPIIRERRDKPWVTYGIDNLFPLKLLDLYNQSAVHGAVVKAKVRYITGRGLTIGDSRLQTFVDKPNPSETLYQVTRKIVMDYEIYNGFCVEILKNRRGRIVEIRQVDYSKVRQHKSDRNILLFSHYWESPYSSGEHRTASTQPNPIEVPRFDPSKNQPRSFIYYNEYQPDLVAYTLPPYFNGLAQIETSVEIANYDLNAIKNGFAGGTLINLLNGEPDTEEEKATIVGDFKASFSSSSNANEPVIYFGDDKEHAATIESINGNDLADRFRNLEERTKQSIFEAHGVTSPVLFGVSTPGKLGEDNKMIEAYELFKETYIIDRQKTVLDMLNDLAEYNGLPREIAIEELKPVGRELPFSAEQIMQYVPEDVIQREIADRYGFNIDEKNADDDADIDTDDDPPDAEVKMAEEITAMMAGYLETVGIPADGVQELDYYTSPVHVDEESGMVQFNIDDIDQLRLTGEERTNAEILTLIQDNPDITATDIAEVMRMELARVKIIIAALAVRGMIRQLGAKLRIQRRAVNLIALLPDNRSALEIRYKYVLRPDALPAASGSRPFCQRLMTMNKLFTRQEIEGMRNTMTASFLPDINDVWKYRGGWYRRPGFDVSVPFCRHQWSQVVLRRLR